MKTFTCSNNSIEIKKRKKLKSRGLIYKYMRYMIFKKHYNIYKKSVNHMSYNL